MKKILVLCLLLVSGWTLVGCSNSSATSSVSNSDYLRVHIRANSNSEEDQSVKYYVKDVVVIYLSKYMKNCKTKKQAIEILEEKSDDIKEIVNGVLKEKGYYYGCNVGIKNEFFPTKAYGDLVLEADYYDALIINLGTGEGQNWWCVMYPNICFNEPTNVVYKSKIKEIIRKIKGE